MTNRFGLSRDISSDIKQKVRQKCAFGCVICGCPVVQYHHFNPPFSQAKEHTVIGITLLCGTCHDKVERKLISKKTVEESDNLPYCRRQKYTKGILESANIILPINIGSCRINAEKIIMYEDEIVFGLTKSEDKHGLININATFNDGDGNEILKIIDNEWITGSNLFDVETKTKLIIRKKRGKISIEMKLSTYEEISITKIDMNYKGFKIFADEKCFKITTPITKSTLNHKGSIFAEIGILLKKDGKALIAANSNGGAAICLG